MLLFKTMFILSIYFPPSASSNGAKYSHCVMDAVSGKNHLDAEFSWFSLTIVGSRDLFVLLPYAFMMEEIVLAA